MTPRDPKPLDLTGHTYGRWRVLGPATPTNGGTQRWQCVCETCGAEHQRGLTIASLIHHERSACRACKVKLHAMDMVSRRFGKLVVIALASAEANKRRVWRCLCDCGTECDRLEYSLTMGRHSSCGCDQARLIRRACKPENLTGQRFGRLVAVRLVSRGGVGGHAKWLWRCDCGATVKVAAYVVKGGKRTACRDGCDGTAEAAT